MAWKIVIVEDEDLLRNGLINTIPWEKYGFEIVGEANNGRKGLELIQELKPDVIFSDIRMAQMDGLTMAEKVHEMDPETQWVFISGYDEFDYALRALKVGAFEYILKPVQLGEVEKTLQKLAEKLEEKHDYQAKYEKLKQLEAYDEEKTKDKGSLSGLKLAIHIMEEEYGNENLMIGDVAKKAYISSSYLSFLLKKETGKTFIEYLTDIRMKHARKLLLETSMKNYEVAEACGFANATYFSTVFKNINGMSPSSFRKEQC